MLKKITVFAILLLVSMPQVFADNSDVMSLSNEELSFVMQYIIEQNQDEFWTYFTYDLILNLLRHTVNTGFIYDLIEEITLTETDYSEWFTYEDMHMFHSNNDFWTERVTEYLLAGNTLYFPIDELDTWSMSWKQDFLRTVMGNPSLEPYYYEGLEYLDSSEDDFSITVSPNPPIVGELTTITCNDPSDNSERNIIWLYQTEGSILDADNDDHILSPSGYTLTYSFEEVDDFAIACQFDHNDGSIVWIETFVTTIIGEEPIVCPTGEELVGDTCEKIDKTEVTEEGYAEVTDEEPPKKKSGGSNEWKTKPTFGLSHQTFLPLVDGGFTFNGIVYDITDNWHTDFPRQNVTLGELNTFEAKVYAEKKLMVQEFLFGIPEAGYSQDAELGVEIWYDYDGIIEEIVVVQETDIVDTSTVNATHSKVKCQSSDTDERCDSTILSMTFLEPLEDDVMALHAIDFQRRNQITYLNEGFDISGTSLNPMNTMYISGPEKYEGLIKITQSAKYSDLWIAEDGRVFNVNEAGSFKWINQVFERYIDTGEPRTRLHSAFADSILYQQELAQKTINELYTPIESISRQSLYSK